MQYFPDDVMSEKCQFGDRIYTWSVLFAIRREWAEEYYEEVCNFHNRKKSKPDKPEIVISEEWAKKLAQYDYFSKGMNSKKPGMNILVKRGKPEPTSEPKKRTYVTFKASNKIQEMFE